MGAFHAELIRRMGGLKPPTTADNQIFNNRITDNVWEVHELIRILAPVSGWESIVPDRPLTDVEFRQVVADRVGSDDDVERVLEFIRQLGGDA